MADAAMGQALKMATLSPLAVVRPVPGLGMKARCGRGLGIVAKRAVSAASCEEETSWMARMSGCTRLTMFENDAKGTGLLSLRLQRFIVAMRTSTARAAVAASSSNAIQAATIPALVRFPKSLNAWPISDNLVPFFILFRPCPGKAKAGVANRPDRQQAVERSAGRSSRREVGG